MTARRRQICLVLVAAGLGGCGGGGTSGGASTAEPALPSGLVTAQHAAAKDFPAVRGRTLQQLADTVQAGAKAGFASSVLVPGRQRVAFGMLATDNSFLYGKSALYYASRPGARAHGPYVAPADSFAVAPPFQSRNAAQAVGDAQAVYETQIPFPSPGTYAMLAVTRTAQGLVGAATQLTVQRSSPVPAVGQRPPAIHTDTVASAGGDIAKIDTRDPHDDMHKVDFHDVIGRRPVALLFSTPRLCQSRVCGPVTDVAVALEKEFGDRVTFIHEEVYVDNTVDKGLRPQMLAFHLETEPWLFTFTSDGRVAARLEGAFGVRAFRQALRSALRSS
jgi:hypothetical protein